jgi:cytosine/adenosine deaminase-related metal-dependent hydrolase
MHQAGIQDERPLLLAGGMIFDGTGQPLFEGDVLIAGNRIEAVVAATESWDPPADAIRIELTGRTVSPAWSKATRTSRSPVQPT